MNGGIVGFEQNPESKLWVSIEIPDKIELKRVLLIGKDKIGKRIGDNLTVFWWVFCSTAKLETKTAAAVAFSLGGESGDAGVRPGRWRWVF
jgi:hypothetical protein